MASLEGCIPKTTHISILNLNKYITSYSYCFAIVGKKINLYFKFLVLSPANMRLFESIELMNIKFNDKQLQFAINIASV